MADWRSVVALGALAAGCTVSLDWDRAQLAAGDSAVDARPDGPSDAPVDTSSDGGCAPGTRACDGTGACRECCAHADCAGARCCSGVCCRGMGCAGCNP